MKRLAAICVLILLLASSNASAITDVGVTLGDQLHFVGSSYWGDKTGLNANALWGYFPGGEFKFQDVTANIYFTTFCAEITENIWENSAYTYTVSNISSTGSSSKPVVLSDFGKWIYWGYQTNNDFGKLVPSKAGITPSLNSEIRGSEVQYALWRQMGYSDSEIQAEIGSLWATYNWAAVKLQYYSDIGSWTSAYNGDAAWNSLTAAQKPGVAWLTLNDNGGGPAQDQFILVAGDLPAVPEPTSLAIWAIAGGLGAAGLSFKRRRQGRWSDDNRQAIMDIVQGRSRV
jgi:hypothetical protein